MLKFLTCVLVSCLPIDQLCLAQLASESISAEEKLIECFLEVDELSLHYCARFAGTYSGMKGTSPRMLRVYGVSSVAPRKELATFHCWGSIDELEDARDIVWCDALRIGISKKKFRILTGRGAERAQSIPYETEAALEENPRAVWPYPELDPFGLIFCHESQIHGRKSSLDRMRVAIMENYVLIASKPNRDGNIVGQWQSSNGGAILTIEFGKQTNFMPTTVRYQARDPKNGKLGVIIGTTRTTWKPYGKTSKLVPTQIVMTCERLDGATTEIDLNWEWIDPEQWEKAPIDFDSLESVANMRQPFMDLFQAPPSALPTNGTN